MSKIFDYKFLIILGLSLVVYFLYREVDLLTKRVSRLEINKPELAQNTRQFIDLPPPPSEEDVTTSSKSSTSKSSKKSSQKSSKKSSVKSINKSSEHFEVHNTMNEALNQQPDTDLNNAIFNAAINNDETIDMHRTVEEYSNENEPKLYSHDTLDTNTNENDSLLVDSLINMVKEDKPVKRTLEELLKLKLDELQNIALANNIDITINGKKKKKADLAKQIYDRTSHDCEF